MSSMESILDIHHLSKLAISMDILFLFFILKISHMTAGFIWLNGHVDILPLLENYELDAFGNLLKFNSQEIFREKQIIVK